MREGPGCVVAPATPPVLTRRQVQVLLMSAEGLTCKEIQAALGLSRGTVTWHLANARQRLDDAPNVASAVWRARVRLEAAVSLHAP